MSGRVTKKGIGRGPAWPGLARPGQALWRSKQQAGALKTNNFQQGLYSFPAWRIPMRPTLEMQIVFDYVVSILTK